MHAATSDLQVVRGGGLLLRFAVLGDMTWVVAEVPATGSAGTSLEEPCLQPHWGIVLDGDVEIRRGRERVRLGPTSAFHVPPGTPAHRLIVRAAARIGGFQPVVEGAEPTDARLLELGFETATHAEDGVVALGGEFTASSSVPAEGEIAARSVAMGDLVLTHADFGPKSGYATGACDVPHWGIVTSGRLVLESASGAEVLGPGDAYHCPPGPPGHRLLAADPATIVDYTPREALGSGAVLADWRRAAVREILAEDAATTIKIASLAQASAG